MGTQFNLTRFVAAPPEIAFAAFSDMASVPGRAKGIARVEMLTDGPTRVGTRFRETRIIMKREATEEMEFTRFEPGKLYALACTSCGVRYEFLFRFVPQGDGTLVTIDSDCQPQTLMAKLFSPLGKLMIAPMKKCVLADVNDLGHYAEEQAKQPSA